jgi:hypothetical protein
VETKLKSKKITARNEKYFRNLAREQKSLATPDIYEPPEPNLAFFELKIQNFFVTHWVIQILQYFNLNFVEKKLTKNCFIQQI